MSRERKSIRQRLIIVVSEESVKGSVVLFSYFIAHSLMELSPS
jgi:hypothetical protein